MYPSVQGYLQAFVTRMIVLVCTICCRRRCCCFWGVAFLLMLLLLGGDGTFQGGGDGAQPRGGTCASYFSQHGARLRLPRNGAEHLVGGHNGAQRQVSNKPLRASRDVVTFEV